MFDQVLHFLFPGEGRGPVLPPVPQGPGLRRGNIHAGGSAEAVEIGKGETKVAETIRPKLIADGMFLVGIDIVGDKILEVNVFSPGNLQRCSLLAGENFAIPVIEAIERKLEIAGDFAGAFDNRALARL